MTFKLRTIAVESIPGRGNSDAKFKGNDPDVFKILEDQDGQREEGQQVEMNKELSHGGPRCNGKTSLDYDGDRGDGNDTRLEIYFGDKNHQDQLIG